MIDIFWAKIGELKLARKEEIMKKKLELIEIINKEDLAKKGIQIIIDKKEF